MLKFTEEQIAFIIHKKKISKRNYVEIASAFVKKFNVELDEFQAQACFEKYKNIFQQPKDNVKTLKEIHRTKKSNSRTASQNRDILQCWNERDDLLETIANTIKKISIKKHKIKKVKVSNNKKPMTLELMLSDVHYGKKVDGIDGNYVDHKVICKRVCKITDVVLKEIKREGKSFAIDRLIIAMIGDIIENADFHGIESQKGCEFGTSKQIAVAIESLFNDLLKPIALTGIQIDIPCITGNHDRIGKDKTYQKPGEENTTNIIYKTLEMLCKASGFTNVKFDIVTGLHTHLEVYGNVIVYEHGDELKNTNRPTLANQMAKRGVQIGKVVDFYRVGHWHESMIYGQGRMIINGSVPGQDSYAESKGFCSTAVQILNYYVKTKHRDNCFFRSFPIYLKLKKE